MMYLVMIHPVGIAKVYTIEYEKSQSTAFLCHGTQFLKNDIAI